MKVEFSLDHLMSSHSWFSKLSRDISTTNLILGPELQR